MSSDPLSSSKAVTDYFGAKAPRWKIFASRTVGEYVLLWIGFPEVADGGIDLVHSIREQRVRWQFKGGNPRG